MVQEDSGYSILPRFYVIFCIGLSNITIGYPLFNETARKEKMTGAYGFIQ